MPTASALHILVKERKLAEELRKRLNKGEDFGELAKSIPLARQERMAAIWVSFTKAIWLKPLMMWCLSALS